MSFIRPGRRQRGFTLVELLTVLTVISALSLIVIPRVMGATRKAREATLQENLFRLRTCVEQFQADTGVYPAQLSDILLPRGNAPATGVTDNGTSIAIPPGLYQGPYLSPQGGIRDTGLPANPFLSPEDPLYSDFTAHWNYVNGIVRPAIPASGTTLNNVPYQAL